ncbi:MAG: aminopeptidase P family protein [Elusimicrobiota bacterium]
MNRRQIRRAFCKRLPDGPILIEGGAPIVRNHDVEYPFRQKSDFLYLSGADEPGCFLLLEPGKGRSTLFIPEIDIHHRIWLGHVPNPREAEKLFGIERVRYVRDLPAAARAAAKGSAKCYAEPEVFRRFKKELGVPNQAAALRDALDELRAVKTEGELSLMRAASEVSAKAHRAVMRSVRPGQYEHEAQAVFESECLRAGLKQLAYPSIVAAGSNAAVLHYFRNNARIKAGDLVLIDAGAEREGYAADITRTFPASGRFDARQRDVYSIVLETQKKCIAASRPGVVSADLHVRSMFFIAEGLKSLGILSGETSGLVESGAVRVFYPHGLTHMLGLDVHDVTGGKKRVMPNPTKVPVRFVAKLEPGFVITMEPGIYFIRDLIEDPQIRLKHKGSVNFARAEKFLDFGGVRIEDDIAITEKEPVNLTDVPKEIKDVEEACRR